MINNKRTVFRKTNIQTEVTKMNIFRTMVKENKKEYIKVSEVTILGQKCELKVAYKNVKSAEVNFEYREIKVALPLKYKM